MTLVVCDGCGKERKPYRAQEVWICGELDDVFTFCFLCVKESERAEMKAMREDMENET